MTRTSKKKVLFVITKANWGGAQRYVYDLATTLSDSYEVAVALGGTGRLQTELDAAGIRTHSIAGMQRDISLLREVKASRALARVIARERPDILHLNSSKAGGIGALMGRLSGVPMVIFTSHGWAFNENRPALARLCIKALHWTTVLLAHRTIVVSNETKRQMNWPFVSKKMYVVHNGYRPAPLLARQAAREHLIGCVPTLSAYREDPWTGTVAELHPIKQHELVIGAYKDLINTHPRVRHIIIGDGELRDALAARVREAGLEHHIFFAGYVPNAAAYLSALDVFTLTSRSESFAYALLEAGAAGLPVVASRVGGIPEIITDEISGLLTDPHDHASVFRALTRILSNPAEATTYGNALKERVLRTFSLEHMLTETRAVYER